MRICRARYGTAGSSKPAAPRSRRAISCASSSRSIRRRAPPIRRTKTGIVVAGKDANGDGWVLADVSGRYQPVEWAKAAIAAYRAHRADRIVAEINNGGDMVEATLRMVDPNVPFGGVHASRGKVARAEPVATLYEQGRIRHLGAFPILEDQMCAFTRDAPWTAGWTAGVSPASSPASSPDRVDALVWALSDLLVQPLPHAGIFERYRHLADSIARSS